VAGGERRPIGFWLLLGVAVTSFGGPLALAALYGPNIVADASASSGFAMVAAAVVFLVPLAIWLLYSRRVNSAGGLYAFVEAAAGRRVALVQAGLWTFSYVLYLIYTTATIVYDTLPAVSPAVRPYRPYLEIAIPLALVLVMLAGRAATLAVTGLLAIGQLVLVAVLAVVTISHNSPGATSFSTGAPAGALAIATAQTSLLYICGSLPLFLGGEVVRPTVTMRRGLVAGYVLTAVGVIAAVAPLAADPAFTRAELPGVSVAQVFSGRGLAITMGVGIAASIAGVMLVEYLALSRLIHAVTSWPVRKIIVGLGVAMLVAAPISLINPDAFYDNLLKPSLVALWLSQAMVFAVYPMFARRHGGRAMPAWTLGLAATAFAMYGIWATLQHASS
jgi:amino acid transporter